MNAPEAPTASIGRGLPRIVELSLALVGLTLTAPLVAVAGALIKVESRGGMFFSQTRVGKGGESFVYHKLRTMRPSGPGPLVTAASDDRITPVGRVLRKTKLDELPSLWHVVKGDMALVGPRPEIPPYVNLDDPLRRLALSVRPGITDPMTLTLRNEEDLLEAVDGDPAAFYREYLVPYKLLGYQKFLSTRTWRGDVRLLMATVWAVVAPSGRPPPRQEEIVEVVSSAGLARSSR